MATQTRRPTGNSSARNNWTASAGNKYDCVSDESSSTYVYRQNSDGVQGFTFSAFDISSSAIAKLTMSALMQRTAAGVVYFTPRIVVNGTQYSGSASDPGTTWADMTYEWATNPDTGSAWLEADIEGTGSNPLQEMVLRNSGTGAGEEMQCYDCSLTVDYTESGGGGLSIPVAMHHYTKNIGGN